MNLTTLINYPTSYRGRYGDIINLQQQIPIGNQGDFAHVGLPYSSRILLAVWDMQGQVWDVINNDNYDVTVDQSNINYTVPFTDFIFGKKMVVFDNIDPINIILPYALPAADVVGYLKQGQIFTFCKRDGTGTINVVGPGDSGIIIRSRTGTEITNNNHVYSILIEEMRVEMSNVILSYRLIG